MQITEESAVGVRIVEAATREFWLEGKLSCPCCPVFLKDDDERCWNVFYDDECCKWKMELGGLDYPIVGTSIGDTEMLWRDVKLAGAEAMIGNKIVSFTAAIVDCTSEAAILFANGVELKFRYDFQTDDSEFAILTGV